jgi:hypothetical protein
MTATIFSTVGGSAWYLLRRLKRIKGKAVISVTRGGDIVSRKTVTVRLRAPRQAP